MICLHIQEAVRLRILELAAERHITINKLADLSGVSASTLKLTLRPYATVKNTGVVTIKKLCQGMEINFLDFWKSPLFENLEIEEETDKE